MVQPTQGDLSALVDLLAGVARACIADAGKLRSTAQTLHRVSRSSSAADPSAILPELQESFRRLAQCVLLIRGETDRLQTVVRAGLAATHGEQDSDSAHE